MPKQVTKGGLAAKLGTGLAKAVEQHKDDETTFGGGNPLPEGIEDGVAQLVECKFDQYKDGDLKGEYFFYAAGIVMEPESANGKKVRGLRTSIMEPICDTPKRSRPTLDDHVQWVLNEFRKLGVDTKNVGSDDLEATAAALKETQPFFSFRTWKGSKQVVEKGADGKFWVGKKGPYGTELAAKNANPFAGQEPRVNEQWQGQVEYNSEGIVGADVQDNSPPAKEEPAAKKTSAPAAKEEPTPAADMSMDDLLAAANEGDEAAQTELLDQAEAAGLDRAEVQALDTWELVVEAINGAAAGGDSVDYAALGASADEGDEDAIAAMYAAAKERDLNPDDYATLTWTEFAEQHLATAADEPEADEWQPAVKEIYFYKPTDPKTKKPAAKASEHEVTAIDEAAKTATLKSLDNPKLIYKGVSWDSLTQE